MYSTGSSGRSLHKLCKACISTGTTDDSCSSDSSQHGQDPWGQLHDDVLGSGPCAKQNGVTVYDTDMVGSTTSDDWSDSQGSSMGLLHLGLCPRDNTAACIRPVWLVCQCIGPPETPTRYCLIGRA
jgi:hypothetical protein